MLEKTRFIGIRSPTKQDGWRHGDISRMKRLNGTNSFMSMCIHRNGDNFILNLVSLSPYESDYP